MEDMCSALDLEPHDKYTGTIERVARVIRTLSSAPDEDLLILVRRVLFAWLIADGDMLDVGDVHARAVPHGAV